MTREELISLTIDKYTDLQRIKMAIPKIKSLTISLKLL